MSYYINLGQTYCLQAIGDATDVYRLTIDFEAGQQVIETLGALDWKPEHKPHGPEKKNG